MKSLKKLVLMLLHPKKNIRQHVEKVLNDLADRVVFTKMGRKAPGFSHGDISPHGTA